MTIHIALVGRNSGHLWNGLKEIKPDKMYLLHSANQDDFKHADEAKKIKKEIEKYFCPTVLVKINPFEMTNIFHIIEKIVDDEIIKSDFELEKFDFAVNVTGGTNIMASGATIGAMLTGIKAYYVQDDRKLPKRKNYCEFLPIPPINVLRDLAELHQKILQILDKSVYEFEGEKRKGVMKQKDLEKKLRKSKSTVGSAIKRLRELGMIEGQEEKVKAVRYKENRFHEKEKKIVTLNDKLVSISELGKVQAKKALLNA